MLSSVVWLVVSAFATAAPTPPPAATLADIDVLRDRLIAFYTNL
jgi:hypothetical protein